MSALAQQHEGWKAANNRLWGAPNVRRLSAREQMAALIGRSRQEPVRQPTLTLSPPTGVEIPADPSGASKMHIPHWRAIVMEVCLKHAVSMMEITSYQRKQQIVHARHEAFWRCSKETRLSLANIGGKMGGFDHTTVIHGIRKHALRISIMNGTLI